MNKQKKGVPTQKTVNTKVTKVEVIRHGRDEMNLVEYPFASLWKNTEPGTEILHEWETTHPITGKTVKAFWRVTGDPKFGLPTPSDEQLYLGLMELTQEAGVQNQVVHFTRYDLLKRLNWPDQQQYYDAVRDAFTRLLAVTITAQNAFWDAKARSFRTVGFSLLDNFDILEERRGRKKSGQNELPLSFFKWNDVLFDSFQSGYLKTLDLDFALSLKSSIALRLYRYLDKKSFDARRTFEVELATLCERHLGMRPNPYPSKYKERLKSAHDELIARGFLESVSYRAMKTKKGDKACYVFTPRQQRIVLRETIVEDASSPKISAEQIWSSQSSCPVQPGLLSKDKSQAGGEQPGDDEQSVPDLLQQMLALQVSPEVARELLQNTPAEDIKVQLDCLSDRAPKDAAAIFVKAVREGWSLPSKYLKRQKFPENAHNSQEVVKGERLPENTDAEEKADATEHGKSAKQETHHLADDAGALQQMTEIGIETGTAERVLAESSIQDIMLQLACLAERNPRDPAALFLYALRRDLPPPAGYLERMELERQQEAQHAGSEGERQKAVARAQRAQAAQEEMRHQMNATSTFYESLSHRARAIVRQKMDVELNQFGAQGRLLYPHPDWLQVLGSLLSDESWAASLGEWEDDWEEEADDLVATQQPLFSHLNLYVDTLCGLLSSGEADSNNLERVREKSFPLLDEDEWEAVKNRALSD